MNILFISNLFPNAREPVKGTFNASQVQSLSQFCSITVIAPTAQAMPAEDAHGARILHPKFFHIPILSRPWNGWLYAKAIEPVIRTSKFDWAFASFAYPDGYGVYLLARKLGFPFAVDVLGSDINLMFNNSFRRKQILRALRASQAVFAKSKALQNTLSTYGIQSHLDYNGVDREKFHPIPREEACRQLGLDPNRRRILYVGNLQPVKGPTVLAEAFRLLCHPERSEGSLAGTAEILRSAQNDTGVDMIFVGDGPERTNIERISSQRSAISTARSQVSSLKSQVCLMGARPHHEVPLWLNACDVLCLPSFNEGLPNVCIEAAACGLPVVASQVGGVPEVVREGVNGFLVPPGDPAALAVALRRALSHPWDRDVIVQSVAPFDWDANARQVVSILESVV